MSDEQLSRDTLFELLSSPRRRYVLYYLRKHGGPVRLTDLAEELAAWENETTVTELSTQARKRTYVSLYQTHIPKLEEAGLITHNPDSGEVSLAAGSSAIDPYIDHSGTDRPWYWYYLGLSATSFVFFLLIVSGAVQFPLVPALGLIMSSFLLLAGVHTVVTRQQDEPAFPEF